MKRFAILLVALLPLAAGAADDDKDKAVKKELERLKGQWKQVSVEREGKEKRVPSQVSVIATIDGDKWTTEGPVGKLESTIAIDPTQKPMAFDRIRKVQDGKGKDEVVKCIYKLEEDTLTICYISLPISQKADGSKERPKEFKTTDGEVIFVYKRVKE